MEKIGLIAGNGSLPIIFAKEAKKMNFDIIAVAIKEEASKDLEKLVDKIYWISVGDLSKLFDVFKKEDIKEAVMIGQIAKKRIYDKQIKIDERLGGLLESLPTQKTTDILAKVCLELERAGIKMLSSTTFLSEFLPKKSTLTKNAPTEKEWEDIEFGRQIAKKLADMDVGQTVVVKEKAVVAVEAMEGTDETVRRAGGIANGKLVVVKMASPTQDERFDIPVIGPRTIKNLIKAKVSCLAIEAEKTFVIDREQTVNLAEKAGISIVAI